MNFISEEFDDENMILTVGFDKYLINQGDSTFVCLWLPTTNVKIEKNDKDKQYPILITNLSNKEVARANKI